MKFEQPASFYSGENESKFERSFDKLQHPRQEDRPCKRF